MKTKSEFLINMRNRLFNNKTLSTLVTILLTVNIVLTNCSDTYNETIAQLNDEKLKNYSMFTIQENGLQSVIYTGTLIPMIKLNAYKLNYLLEQYGKSAKKLNVQIDTLYSNMKPKGMLDHYLNSRKQTEKIIDSLNNEKNNLASRKSNVAWWGDISLYAALILSLMVVVLSVKYPE